jgi:PleD family two-component response regulator
LAKAAPFISPSPCLQRIGLPTIRRQPARTPGHLTLHVLIVDDNAIARELLVGMAQSWGWQVDAADSGPQALAMLAGAGSSLSAPLPAIFD